MEATRSEKDIFGDNFEIVSRNKDYTIYRLSDESGEVVMTSYSVFPGITLIYNDVHIQSYIIEKAVIGNIFEINHCRQGRIECCSYWWQSNK